MSALVGGLLNANWVEYRGIYFPLDFSGLVQRQPQQPFPPATQLGPADRPPLDQRLAAMTFADTSLGIGTLDLQEIEGVTSVWWSTLETRFKGRVSLPAAPRVLVTPPLASIGGAWFPPDQPVRAVIFRTPTTRTLYAYTPGSNRVVAYDLTVATPATTLLAKTFTAALVWRDKLVGVGPGGTTLVTAAGVVTQPDSVGKVGLCVHDNKLWSFDTSVNQLVWSIDPAAGWTRIGDVLWLEAGEALTSLADFRDKTGQPAVHAATTRRVVGYDEEPGEWREYWPVLGEVAETTQPWLHVWTRDSQMYMVLPGDPLAAASRYVMQFTGSTDQVGPGKSADFPYFQYGPALHVHGNVHYLYIWCGAMGPSPGAVMVRNDAGGWHCLFQPTQASPPPVPQGAWVLPSQMAEPPANTHGGIVGGTVYAGTVYTLHQDGTLVAIEDRDDNVSPPERVGGLVDARPRDIWWPETDCGLPNHWKSGAYLYCDCRMPDNSPGLVPGAQLELFYTADGAPWYRLPFGEPLASHPVGLLTTLTTTGGARTWPLLIPFPDGDWDHQVGIPFRRVQFAGRLRGPGNSYSSTLRELTLYYTKWVAQRYAYQAVIDLSRENFPDAESTFMGRSAPELRNLLLTFANDKLRGPLTFGANEWQVRIPAADCFLAGQEEVGEQRARFQVTFRDLSAYEDA